MESVSVKEGWSRNGRVRLHYLISGAGSADLTPIFFIPGAFGSAELYLSELKFLAPRPCVSISLRGQGKSDAPLTGYSLAHYASDIASVVEDVGVSDFVLMAYSRGVPYAIRYCAQTARQLRGLILGDYPARLTKPSSEWADRVQHSLLPEVAKPHVVHAIVEESEDVELWGELDRLRFPVLVLRGLKRDALLGDPEVNLYRDHLVQVEVIDFPESGHELWKPSYDRFMGAIEDFLLEADEARETPAS